MVRTFLLCLLLCVVPALVHAQTPGDDEVAVADGEPAPPEFEPSNYGMLSFAIGVDQFDDFPGSEFNEGLGVDVALGYRWDPRFSVEAQFVYMEGLDQKGGPLEVRYEIFTANLKVYPVSGRVEPYMYLGVGGGRFEERVPSERDEDLGSAVRFGAGIELNLASSFALVLGGDYLLTFGALDGLDVFEFKVGVISRFW